MIAQKLNSEFQRLNESFRGRVYFAVDGERSEALFVFPPDVTKEIQNQKIDRLLLQFDCEKIHLQFCCVAPSVYSFFWR